MRMTYNSGTVTAGSWSVNSGTDTKTALFIHTALEEVSHYTLAGGLWSTHSIATGSAISSRIARSAYSTTAFIIRSNAL